MKDKRIFDLWLACYTQEEIAEREGLTREGVRDILAELGDFGKLAENAKALANHAVDFEMQNQAAEIKLRAERRAGEMLKEMDLPSGARGLGINQFTPEVELHDVTPPPRLEELGISKIQSYRWQLEAEIPAGAISAPTSVRCWP